MCCSCAFIFFLVGWCFRLIRLVYFFDISSPIPMNVTLFFDRNTKFFTMNTPKKREDVLRTGGSLIRLYTQIENGVGSSFSFNVLINSSFIKVKILFPRNKRFLLCQRKLTFKGITLFYTTYFLNKYNYTNPCIENR